MECNPKFDPVKVIDAVPVAGIFENPMTAAWTIASNDNAEVTEDDALADETTRLDAVEGPRNTLQMIELSAIHLEFSFGDPSILDIPDQLTNPSPTAATATDIEPLEGMLEDPRTTEST